ncbi:MAG: hypothetical protein HQK60_09835 [Deltaproteobacteria bacterium]|nr:hypothetical protein [Deltaproteobacteria bacterium]
METDTSKRVFALHEEFAKQIGQATDGLYIFARAANDIDIDADKLSWISDVSYESAIKANDLFHELLAIADKLAEKVTGEKIFFGDVREYNNPHKDYFKIPGKTEAK